MFLRIDGLQVEIPVPAEPDPNAAAAVQELLGGRFGEMSTLMNYMYQSFNFRGRDGLKQYYDLIANIATEELGHIELVSASINSLLNGIRSEGDPATGVASYKSAFKDVRNSHHHIVAGHATMVTNSMANPGAATTCSTRATWSSIYCTTSSSRTARARTSCASMR